ncbi:translocation/assembly module TamB domain-containing protein [Psychroflexus sediminis]|uniref:Autotransporter translocation and assembly factor TamB n=1 Tax=Psychroflexus sediminis TaxID=470826 RepID=A0A1G7WSE7_9FLAO|nr:translocation/assembly module TamB domain-containing protein [Psychroflexus sediminis]SDG74824.1 Autotransporter translocation and assembly factor TamB [Psychroflexus sediminis]
MLLRILLGLFIFFILLILFIRSPWGQDIIVGKATDYVSEKIDTKFNIGKLYVSFSGNITLEDLYLEDTSRDTLVYSEYLEANVPFRPLLFGDEIQVDFVDWRGLKANIYRKDSVQGFNFQFIIDAFTADAGNPSQTQDNSESSFSASLGSLSFTEFDLSYYDEVTGIDAKLNLGGLELENEMIDLENMKFHLSEVSLQETSFSLSQLQASKSIEEEQKSRLPWILVDELSVQDVDIHYNSSTEGIASEAYIDDFSFSDLDANLNTQVVALDQWVWKDSRLKLEKKSASPSKEKAAEVADSDEVFTWPEWEINVNDIAFENHQIEFYQNGKRPSKGEFSAEAIAVEKFNFKIKDLSYSKNKSLNFDLNDLRFKEESGLVLEEFQMLTRLNSEETALKNLRLKFNKSLIFADLNLKYNTIQNLINSPLNSTANFDVSSLKINVEDLYVFSPELRKNNQIRKLAQHNLEGNFKAYGDVDTLNVTQFNLYWGENTQLQLSGSLSRLTEVEKLGFDFKNLTAKTIKQDLSQFISESDLGISIPKTIAVNGSFRKSASNYSSNSKINSSLGDIQLKAYYNSTDAINYKIDLDIKSLKLGELLQNEQVGNLSMQLNSEGKGNTIYELSGELSSKIDSIRWNAYTFSGMEIQGNLDEGTGDIKFDYADKNLKFDFVSTLELDSVSPQVDMKFNLEGINTQELGLTTKDIRAKVLANIQFKGDANRYQLDAQLEDGLVVYDNRPYYLGNFDFSSEVDSTKTVAEISSQFLNGNLKANANIEGISRALESHFKKYSKDSASQSQSKRPLHLDANLKFINSPILSEVFVDGIRQMDTLQASFQFDEEKALLTSALSLPYLNYKDNEVEGLRLEVQSEKSYIKFDLGFDNIYAGPLDVAKTQIQGNYEDRLLSLDLDAYKNEKELYSSSVSVQFEDEDLYRISVSSDQVILNGSSWTISEENEIVYQNEKIRTSNFSLHKNSQHIALRDDLDFEKRHLGVTFDNFELLSLFSYFNPDEKLTSGKLSGNFVLIEPFVSNGLISNLNIDDLKVTEVALGNLALKAVAKPDDDYELDLSLKDAGVDLAVDGVYHTNPAESELHLKIDLNKLEMQTLENFATEYIKNSKGDLQGDFSIDGSLDDLDYDGQLTFEDVQFNLLRLNTLFRLKDENIKLSKNKLSFDDFTVEDIEGESFTTNGFIDLEEVTNPKFDLSFNAEDFQLLNSNAKDNELYFGKLIFSADASLKGDLDFPKVRGNLTINENTDLTYIVPESQVGIEEIDGIVVFVNKENPDDILTQQKEEDVKAVLTGIDLKTDIKIQKKSKIKVVFNERTGDNVKVQGGGDFKFSISRTGKMKLLGKYEVTDGIVELNFYDVVKRKFDIAPSSSISWSGNLYNADLDLRAIYRIETSTSALMATQTAGESSVIQNRYKQQLPFLVYLDVDGEIMSPELSFQLDMPEDKQGAINGTVYGRVNQVNQQKDLLNKQIFSLLVLNRFYPASGSDGSQGGAASMATENINQALSDQLNRFSDKLTGNTGINLNFDVNSYTDYQGSTAQDRTDLNVSAQKKFFDDRLVVEAGSSVNVQGEQRQEETQPVIGNVSVEYLLTEDGRWKLKGFRKSEYENVIDGQVFVSGIALVFTREFNKFKVLWDKAFRESLKEGALKVESNAQKKSEDKQKSENNTDG